MTTAGIISDLDFPFVIEISKKRDREKNAKMWYSVGIMLFPPVPEPLNVREEIKNIAIAPKIVIVQETLL